jgi:hypothetical protein
MVRRRSTVRFVRGLPGSDAIFENNAGPICRFRGPSRGRRSNAQTDCSRKAWITLCNRRRNESTGDMRSCPQGRLAACGSGHCLTTATRNLAIDRGYWLRPLTAADPTARTSVRWVTARTLPPASSLLHPHPASSVVVAVRHRVSGHGACLEAGKRFKLVQASATSNFVVTALPWPDDFRCEEPHHLGARIHDAAGHVLVVITVVYRSWMWMNPVGQPLDVVIVWTQNPLPRS